MTNLKKIILSLFVIIVFVFYAIYQQRAVIVPVVQLKTSDVTPSVPVAIPAKPTDSGKAPVASVPVATPPVKGKFKDGAYTGNPASAYYEDIQVQAIVKGGQLVDVVFLNTSQMPNRSIQINSYAFPILKSEAIQVQSAQVDAVSGATDTSGAFISTLSSALAQAL